MNTITEQAQEFTLSTDQQNAATAFNLFLLDPIETVFVLSGFSGCGKSTLVKTLLEQIPSFLRTTRLINPNHVDYDVVLTATTNKAAENLAQLAQHEVRTIHSYLGLRVQTDFKTNVTSLIPRSNNLDHKENVILFIDEASYVDSQLLNYIFKFTRNCKIVFIGDPAQLTPIKSVGVPVFDANFTGAHLSEVVRQAKDNPIVELSTKFRHTVNTGKFFSFKPDGHHVKHMNREDFNKAIEAEFTRPDWRYQDSKILAWTNKCVIGFNHYVRNHVKGDPHFEVGDYAVCNSYLQAGKHSIKTDQLVQITGITEDYEQHGVLGNRYSLDHVAHAFQPKTLESKNARIKQARANGDLRIVAEIETSWVDLRAAYACTVNKAQGSTFDKVFIDLDDIRRCNSGDQIARMMYVAVSRARHRVVLTGDLA